jgi:hypothetical protein
MCYLTGDGLRSNCSRHWRPRHATDSARWLDLLPKNFLIELHPSKSGCQKAAICWRKMLIITTLEFSKVFTNCFPCARFGAVLSSVLRLFYLVHLGTTNG